MPADIVLDTAAVGRRPGRMAGHFVDTLAGAAGDIVVAQQKESQS